MLPSWTLVQRRLPGGEPGRDCCSDLLAGLLAAPSHLSSTWRPRDAFFGWSLLFDVLHVESIINYPKMSSLNSNLDLIWQSFLSLGPSRSCQLLHARLSAYDAPNKPFESKRSLREVRNPVSASQRHHLADQVHPEQRLKQEIVGIGFQRVQHCKYQDWSNQPVGALSFDSRISLIYFLWFFSCRRALAETSTSISSRSWWSKLRSRTPARPQRTRPSPSRSHCSTKSLPEPASSQNSSRTSLR